MFGTVCLLCGYLLFACMWLYFMVVVISCTDHLYSGQFSRVNIFLNWNIFVNFEDNIEDTKLPSIQYVLSCDSVACFTVRVVHV